MPNFVGDSFGGATQAYLEDQNARRAAAANTLSQILQQRNLNRQFMAQQNQLGFENRFRQQALSYQQQQEAANRALQLEQFRREAVRDALMNQWHQDEVGSRNKQIDTEATRYGTAQGANDNANEFNEAQQAASDPSVEFDDSKYKTLNDAQRYTLNSLRKSALQKAMSEYTNESQLADMQNELNDLNQKIPQQAPPATVGHWFTGGSSPNPAADVYKAQIARRLALQSALQPYQKDMGSYIQPNPQTMRFQPISARPTMPAPVAAPVVQPTLVQPTAPAPVLPAPTRKPIAFTDGSGRKFLYVGTAANPATDRNPASWQAVQ